VKFLSSPEFVGKKEANLNREIRFERAANGGKLPARKTTDQSSTEQGKQGHLPGQT